MTRTTQSTSNRLLLLAVAVVLALGVGTTPARAAAGIEGVWSFNGGRIAVQRCLTGPTAGQWWQKPSSPSAPIPWASRFGRV